MKKYFYLIKLIVVFLSGLCLNMYAQQNENNNNQLTLKVDSLDQAWQNRETKQEQEIILKLVQSEPEIPQDFEIAWRVARLVYFIGNFGIGEELSKDIHVKVFHYGYKAGETAKNLQPTRVEGHYWYAINLGSYSLANGVMSALNNASIGRDALLEAVKIDPTYHWGGPYRILGRYYQEVPRIISFGDKKKAEEYFLEAVKLAPTFRLNTVYLGTLMRDEGDKEKALKLFQEAEELKDVDGVIEEKRYKKNLALDIKKTED